MKRGSNAQIISSQGGIAIVGGSAVNANANANTNNKINFMNESKRRPTGVGSEAGALGGIIHDSSHESLPVQSPNLLRKKVNSK
mgnify:CR=1 FL=1